MLLVKQHTALFQKMSILDFEFTKIYALIIHIVERPLTFQVSKIVPFSQATTTMTYSPLKSCPSKNVRQIYWPVTTGWDVVERACPQNPSELASFKCSDHGQWIGQPNMSRCKSATVNSVLKNFANVKAAKNFESTKEFVSRLSVELETSEYLYGGDLLSVTESLKHLSQMYTIYQEQNDQTLLKHVDEIFCVLLSGVVFYITSNRRACLYCFKLKKINPGQHRTFSTAEQANEKIAAALNNLLKDSRQEIWTDVSPNEKMEAALNILSAIENYGLTLSKSLPSTTLISKSKIDLEITVIPELSDYIKFPSRSLYDSKIDSISVPKEAFSKKGETVSKFIFASYRNLGFHMEPTSNGNMARKILASNVITALVPQKTVSSLTDPISMTFIIDRFENYTNPSCVFWQNYVIDGQAGGKWSDDGCKVQTYNRSHVVCACNHLTVFAVLMDVKGIDLEEVHQVTLTFITYIGCVVSIVALALTLIILSLLRGFSGERATIHKNLCFCLLVAELTFLLGISRTDDRLTCGVVAGFLHYFFLASFAWMLLEGFQLYVLFVQVFETCDDRRRRKCFYFFSYGMPLIIVTISLIIDHESYGTQKHCWLNADNYFVFSFVGPVVVVLIANFMFLIMALVILCKHSHSWQSNCKKHFSEKSNVDKFGLWLKAAFVLIFLLGLTWSFGLFYISSEAKLAAYLFTVLNSLQGVFIFIFHVLLNDKLHKEYRKWLRRSDWLPDWLRSSSLSYDHAPNLMGDFAAPPVPCAVNFSPADLRIQPMIDNVVESSTKNKHSNNVPFLLSCFCSMTDRVDDANKLGSNRHLLLQHTNSLTINDPVFNKPLFSYRKGSDGRLSHAPPTPYCCQCTLPACSSSSAIRHLPKFPPPSPPLRLNDRCVSTFLGSPSPDIRADAADSCRRQAHEQLPSPVRSESDSGYDGENRRRPTVSLPAPNTSSFNNAYYSSSFYCYCLPPGDFSAAVFVGGNKNSDFSPAVDGKNHNRRSAPDLTEYCAYYNNDSSSKESKTTQTESAATPEEYEVPTNNTIS
uniref:Latrophilin-3 n=1 Tax=Romanomermis culicivorax TaxID=13658 RepID=A0A915JBB7_ROMCU